MWPERCWDAPQSPSGRQKAEQKYKWEDFAVMQPYLGASKLVALCSTDDPTEPTFSTQQPENLKWFFFLNWKCLFIYLFFIKNKYQTDEKNLNVMERNIPFGCSDRWILPSADINQHTTDDAQFLDFKIHFKLILLLKKL